MEDIWDDYDSDKNGHLDRAEFKTYLNDTLDDVAGGSKLEDDEFNKIYDEFDVDQNGTISKDEMFEVVLHIFGFKNVEIDYSKLERKTEQSQKKATSFELEKQQILLK